MSDAKPATAVGSDSSKPKFKVGDYLTNDESVYLEVVAVVTDSVMPVYGIRSPKKYNVVKWSTEWELENEEKLKLTPAPDFKAYEKLKPGDIIRMGRSDDREYMQVLARVGDTILISKAPDVETVKSINKLSEQLKNLTDGEVDMMGQLDKKERSAIRAMASTRRASKMAQQWEHVHTIALYNWPIITE